MKVRVRYDLAMESWCIETKSWYNFAWAYEGNKIQKENAIAFAEAIANPEIIEIKTRLKS